MKAPIHSLRAADVFRELDTSPEGLRHEEAASRLSLFGANALAEAPRPSWPRTLISHVAHPMAFLLWAAGLIALLSGDLPLGATIWILVLVNGGFSFWQEHRAQQAMAALARLLPIYSRAVRSGKEVRVPASEMVPGDVLILAEGDNIPADARVVEEYGLRTNNSTLTGEAMPARKTGEASLRDDITELEQPNLVFAGTSVVSGTGRAVVYATGMLTQFGRIVRLTQEVKEGPSPLQRELGRVTRVISLAAIGIGALAFVVGAFEIGLPRYQAFLMGLGIIVAAVPEGLTPTVTLTLAMAEQRLAQRGVLVKKLAIVEALGTVSVVCTDKSGTLTENQMTIREVWAGGQSFKVSGAGYDPTGRISPSPAGSPAASDLGRLLVAASLCNNARLNPPSPDRPYWSCLGDQTEAAMHVLAIKGGVAEEAVAESTPRIHEIPFDARRKRMSTIHREGSRLAAYVKGAPREILQLSTHIHDHGEILPLDDNQRAKILEANDAYARNAMRVLALAERTLPMRAGGFTAEGVERDLTFLGLVAMMDPPRPEVAGAIERLRSGRVRMVMITGDYGLTAESVARRIGMLSSPHPRILTGAELDAMGDIQLRELIDRHETVFARMAPEHKLRLVSAFQAHGDVVAVVGDGVNDAPALRKADIGIAMGIVGTDVAKEAADVILTNDNFASLSTAVEEGRAIYDNLRKFIKYIFASNVPEILPFLLSALLNIPLALQIRQILAIDLGTDLFPALALGAEKPDPDVMQRPPRRRHESLISRKLLQEAFLWLGPIEAALCYAGFILIYAAFGTGDDFHLPQALAWIRSLVHDLPSGEQVTTLASTVFFAGVVMAQIGNAFACRYESAGRRRSSLVSNPQLLTGILVELLIILALVYLPGLNTAFQLQPLPAAYWLVLGLFAPVLFGLDRFRSVLAGWVRGTRNSTKGGGTPP
jgi:magnesium-transporting ATPase (P-type)